MNLPHIDENIEYAAQKVSIDMQSVFEKYKTGGANFVLNLGYYGSTAYASYLIAGMGPVGLAVDLVWLASDVVVGDALWAKINNFVTVECANGVAMATNNVFIFCIKKMIVKKELKIILQN